MNRPSLPPINILSDNKELPWTLSGAVDYYLEEIESEVSKVTWKKYRYHLRLLTERTNMLPPRQEHIKSVLDRWDNVFTARSCYTSFRVFFNFLERFGIQSPIDDIFKPRARMVGVELYPQSEVYLVPPQDDGIPRTLREGAYLYIRLLERVQRSPETLRRYKTLFKKLTSQTDDLYLSADYLQDFISVYQNRNTAHSCFRHLRAFYNVMESKYGIPNPMKQVMPPKRKRVVRHIPSFDNVKTLLNSNEIDYETRILLGLMADTGIRIGEAVSLKIENVKFNYILVDGKTGERIVPISSEIRNKLLDLFNYRADNYIFTQYSCVGCWSSRVSRQIKKAGFKASAHDFRRFFATNWRGSTFDLMTILGHTDPSTTMKYIHRNQNELIEQHTQNSAMNINNSRMELDIFKEVSQAVEELPEFVCDNVAEKSDIQDNDELDSSVWDYNLFRYNPEKMTDDQLREYWRILSKGRMFWLPKDKPHISLLQPFVELCTAAAEGKEYYRHLRVICEKEVRGLMEHTSIDMGDLEAIINALVDGYSKGFEYCEGLNHGGSK